MRALLVGCGQFGSDLVPGDRGAGFGEGGAGEAFDGAGVVAVEFVGVLAHVIEDTAGGTGAVRRRCGWPDAGFTLHLPGGARPYGRMADAGRSGWLVCG